jgi:transposase-like protein
MSKLRVSQNQMKAALLELSAGRSVQEVSRKYGISLSTLYRRRANLPTGHQSNDQERLRSLEAEHRRLKKQFAELTLDYAALRAALVGEVMGDC